MSSHRRGAPKRGIRQLHPQPEALEARCLLTAELGTDGTLTVTGRPTADLIQLSRVEDEVQVVENGAAPVGFSVSAVRAIVVRGLEGHDRITVGPGLIGATLDGGPGRDTLTGGEGDDMFLSRDGEADVIVGGLGIDRVWSDSPDTVSGVEVINPMPVALDNQTQVVKVLVLSWDPLVPSEGNRHLHEVFNWMSPAGIAERYRESMERNAGGAVRFEIVEWRNINDIPVFEDGFRYTPDQYVRNRRTNTGWHLGVSADFRRIVEEQRIVPLIDSGVVDEVWHIGDHYFSLPGESWMAGPGAFFINGPVYGDIPTIRPFACMGFSYERPDTLTHNMGHRTEATLNRIYGGWNLANPVTNWDKFSANHGESNGPPGVGTAHFPANGEGHYDYANTRTVLSTADDWLNYPALTGATTPITRTAWSKMGREYQWEYFEWYYNHLPRASGVNADGKQNNWWKYLYNFDNYTHDGQPRPLRASAIVSDLYSVGGTTHRFQVAYSGAVFIDRASLGDGDILVRGPNDQGRLARLVEISSAVNGPYLVGTYEIDAPGGTWNAGDRGTYTLSLMPDAVRDVMGASVPSGNLGAFRVRSAGATALDVSSSTSLLLPFDNHPNGAAGETPAAHSGVSYTTGRVGQAIRLGATSTLRYPVLGNIAPGSGTIEFWIRPDWDAGVVEPSVLFQVGQTWNNGFLIQIDGAFNVRFQQWGDDPATSAVESHVERGIGVGGHNWRGGQWHHIAATWGGQDGELAFYVDGVVVGVERNPMRIPAFSTTDFRLGAGTSGGGHFRGSFDEFRILDRALSASEIAADYRAGIGYGDLVIALPAQGVALGDAVPLQAISTMTGSGTTEVGHLAAWTSSNPSILALGADGMARALAAGRVTLTARLDIQIATRTIDVADLGRPRATLDAQPIHSASHIPYLFDVVYADDQQIQSATIGSEDIRVAGPGGFHAFAELVAVDAAANGPTRRATYRIVPRGGLWRPADNGTYTIELTGFEIGDTTGQWASPAILGGFTVAIPGALPNHAPQFRPIPDEVVDEGQPWGYVVQASDPDPGQMLTYTLGPGSPAGMAINPWTGRITWTPPDGPASYTITVHATDSGAPAATASQSFVISVRNVAPSAVFQATASVPEGSPIMVSLAAPSDPSPADVAAGFTYAFDHGDLSGFGAYGTSSTHIIPTIDEGSRTVRVRIRDKDGGAREYTTTVSITNVSPTVTAGGDVSLTPGTPLTRSGSFTDPGADAWVARVDYGDGSGIEPLVILPGKMFELNHRYAKEGLFTVVVSVDDGDGGVGQSSFVVVVTAPVTTVQQVTSASIRGNVSTIVLSFSDALDSNRAENISNYFLLSAGRDLMFGTRDDVRSAVRSAVYNATANTVTLTPTGKLRSTAPMRLTVLASNSSTSVTDARGNLIDGNGDGVPGGNYVGRVGPLAYVKSQRTITSRTGITAVLLSFNLPLDMTRAQVLGNYSIVTAGTDGRFGTADDRVVALKKAFYKPSNRTVTLTPASPLLKTLLYKITVNGTSAGAGLADTGRDLLDGNRDGIPGGNYVGWFRSTARASISTRNFRLMRPYASLIRIQSQGYGTTESRLT